MFNQNCISFYNLKEAYDISSDLSKMEENKHFDLHCALCGADFIFQFDIGRYSLKISLFSPKNPESGSEAS